MVYSTDYIITIFLLFLLVIVILVLLLYSMYSFIPHLVIILSIINIINLWVIFQLAARWWIFVVFLFMLLSKILLYFLSILLWLPIFIFIKLILYKLPHINIRIPINQSLSTIPPPRTLNPRRHHLISITPKIPNISLYTTLK